MGAQRHIRVDTGAALDRGVSEVQGVGRDAQAVFVPVPVPDVITKRHEGAFAALFVKRRRHVGCPDREGQPRVPRNGNALVERHLHPNRVADDVPDRVEGSGQDA